MGLFRPLTSWDGVLISTTHKHSLRGKEARLFHFCFHQKAFLSHLMGRFGENDIHVHVASFRALSHCQQQSLKLGSKFLKKCRKIAFLLFGNPWVLRFHRDFLGTVSSALECNIK